MKKKTLAQLDYVLTQAIHAYIKECGSVKYARKFIQIALCNEQTLEKVFKGIK